MPGTLPFGVQNQINLGVVRLADRLKYRIGSLPSSIYLPLIHYHYPVTDIMHHG